jgi:Protein of unknown function (DUF4012)
VATRVESVDAVCVVLLVALGTLSGFLASGRPTGFTVSDAAVRGALAAIACLAASKARPFALVLMAGAGLALCLLLGSGLLIDLLAGASLLAASTSTFDRHQGIFGAAAAAAEVTVHLRLPQQSHSMVVTGSVVAIVLPTVLSGYLRSCPQARRRVNAGVAVAGGVTVVLATGFGIAVLQTRADISAGVRAAEGGLAAAHRGERDQAITDLNQAATSLRRAHRDLAAWWSQPGRAVPVLGQQVTAALVLTVEGAKVSDAGAKAASALNVKNLTLRDGVIDLATIEALNSPMNRLVAALAHARTAAASSRSPWLLPPIHNRLQTFLTTAASAQQTTSTSLDAIRVAPDLLGAHGPRHYFVVFTTPAESRGMGGFIGDWAELTAVQGRISLTRVATIGQLIADPDPRVLTGLTEYQARYGGFAPEVFLRDLGYSPDFPTDAQVMEQLYPQAGGEPVQGVISLDPYAMAALLQMTGPIDVPGYGQTLTATNAADILLSQQYLSLPDKTQRDDFLGALAQATFSKLLNSRLLSFAEMAQAVGPAAQGRRLMINSQFPAEEAVLSSLGVAGAFPSSGDGDFVGLITQNSANNKIDVFLHRALQYQVSLDPATHALSATATITLTNSAPTSGLPDVVIGNTDPAIPVGANRVYLSFYSTDKLKGADLDGSSTSMDTQRELGRWVYSTFITIPSGQSATLTLDLSGSIATPDRYQLGIATHPLSTPDEDVVSVQLPPGDSFTRSSGLLLSGNRGHATLEPLTNLTLSATVASR